MARETRLVTRKRPDGSTEISVYDKRSERESRTGLTAPNDREADKVCRQLAEQFKRAGDTVTHKEMG